MIARMRKQLTEKFSDGRVPAHNEEGIGDRNARQGMLGQGPRDALVGSLNRNCQRVDRLKRYGWCGYVSL
jgi:hypothetical protein